MVVIIPEIDHISKKMSNKFEGICDGAARGCAKDNDKSRSVAV